ncbi:hypothetical protein V8B55DRAFT_1518902 [Mucor lusitanicus]
MNTKEINDIARRLTQQWTSLIRSRMQTPSSAQERAFMKQLEANGSIVFQYENQELLDKAMEVIPLQRLYEEAEAKLEEQGGEESLEDLRFFVWVNNAPCEYCQNAQTRGVNHLQPTAEDLRFGANVVEGYHCSSCNRITRFPRYNDPGKLLETRRGRCGEWANCFTLCCRAVGSEARIVYDTTDHVWTEVYSEYEQRWIHCDSCEEAWDRPLLYSVGWNKQLNYCTAFSVDEAVDVTKRYTRNWPQVLTRRTKIREPRLAVGMSAKRQEHLDQSRRDVLNQRRVKELLELEEDSKKVAVKDDEMIGRQSGSLAWRKSRGETGDTAATASLMSKLELNDWKKQKLDTQYTLLGNATMQCDGRSFVPNIPYVRITSAIPDQRGGVYCKQSIRLDSSLKGIQVEFAFRITNSSADGFAFLIQAQGEQALGGGGCELGYGGVRHSLAVEFDTYQSSDRCADPSANHISVHGRKPPHSNSAHQDYSLGTLRSKIRLLSNGIIEIGLAEAQDAEYIQVLKITNHNFMEYLMPKETAWVGFTASTGGLAENHDVQMLSLFAFTQ